MKPRIWDTFMFRGELDILEMRLGHLEETVYRHVIVEADTTFSGDVKPLWFWENRSRFMPWSSKIIYLSVSRKDLPRGRDMPMMAPGPVMRRTSAAWRRENALREYCKRGLYGVKPRDIILIGDADEIPDPGVLARLRRKPPDGLVVLKMRNHVFAVDWTAPEPWFGTIAVTRKRLGRMSVSDARRQRETTRSVKGGGHHFTWLGGPDAIRAKVQGAAHQELATRILDANDRGLLYEQGMIPWEDVLVKMSPVDVDETYPDWIRKQACPPSWFRPRS